MKILIDQIILYQAQELVLKFNQLPRCVDPVFS